jgi:eukaryotic-like serine/threonine-protein kinase
MSTATDPCVGTVLDGRYELTGHLGQGGMGTVFEAIQRTLNRKVAVKLIKPTATKTEEYQKRFYLEASLCARLHHPNTVRVFDFGCHEDQFYYIVMEHLVGRSLQQLIQEEAPVSPGRALGLIREVLSALIEAHEAGLVHRDLKPSNLFLSDDGTGLEQVKILDFGIVKQIDSEAETETTNNQGTMGSPHFMSPEQIQGLEVDARSDLYSLGIILYQLLSGQLPFSSPHPTAVMMKHIAIPVPKLNPSNHVPQAIESLLRKVLEKEPGDRFFDAREMLGRIDEVQTKDPENLALPKIKARPFKKSSTSYNELSISELETRTIEFEPGTNSIDGLKGVSLDGFVAFIDLSCPYCFALFERISGWGLADGIEWRMIEHQSHQLEGGFDLHQEELLSNEVFEVHHRAPDITLNLPPQRCQSTLATYLLSIVGDLFPEKANALRQEIYKALWQEGLNIGDISVLQELLDTQKLPHELLGMCSEEPEQQKAAQSDWEQGDFDFNIPILTQPKNNSILVGLPDQNSLAEFLLGNRKRIIDKTVCFYQQKPTLLLCGWLSQLLPLLSDLKSKTEVIQAPTAGKASELLAESAVPALLVLEEGHLETSDRDKLCQLARSRSVPWLVASRTPSAEGEIESLSAGAIEYLPVQQNAAVARARLARVLSDRFDLSPKKNSADPLTKLPTRSWFLERLEGEWERAKQHEEHLSLVLLNLSKFKAYNRTHGYLSGDKVLTDLSKQFKKITPAHSGHLARFSGNEFAILLSGCDESQTKDLSKKMLEIVADANIKNRSNQEDGRLNARVGTATLLPAHLDSVYSLIDAASQDLDANKGQ